MSGTQDGEPAGGSHSLVWAFWALALVGAAGALLVRGIEPALLGVWVGTGEVINGSKLAGAFLSQLFAVGGLVTMGFAAARLANGDAGGLVRAMGIGVGLVMLLSLLIASGALTALVRALLALRIGHRLPPETTAVMATTVAVFALPMARERAVVPELRGPALAVGGAAVAALSTAGAEVVASRPDAAPELLAVARVLATGSWAISFALVTFALAWSATARHAAGARWSPGRVAAVVALLVAAGATYLAKIGSDPDAAPMAIFFSRAVEGLVGAPLGYAPVGMQALIEVTRWSALLAVALVAPRGMARSVPVALALLAAGCATLPLGAAALALAAYALGLAPENARIKR